jgi:hypothetical protein
LTESESAVLPRDRSQWIDAGVQYLKAALDTRGRFGLKVALSAYNHGISFTQPTHYGSAVFSIMRGCDECYSRIQALSLLIA